jgi:hypothetical protein
VAGATGSQGATGPQGAVGTTGPQGIPGTPGATGAAGPTGASGATGPTGATGAAGTQGLAEYAYIYSTIGQTIAINANTPLDSNGIMTAGITHAPGSTGINLINAGDYMVTFSVSGTEPSQFAIFQNGAPVSGATYGSGAGTQQNTGFVIVRASAGDTLTLNNHSSSAAVGLASVVGGTQAEVNASVSIEKLSP